MLPAKTLSEVEAVVTASLLTVAENAEEASTHTLGEPDVEDLAPLEDTTLPEDVVAVPIELKTQQQVLTLETPPLEARDTIIMATHMQVKSAILANFEEKDVTLSADGKMTFISDTEETFCLHQPLQSTQAATLTHYITQIKVTDAMMKSKTFMFAFTTEKGRHRFEQVLLRLQ